MSKIKQLSPAQIQKIAAGEVVERPANVVKELLENALDAGATHITMYVDDGGRKQIRIIDDGHGMSKEDAFMCIKHHATSKISSIDDLQTLQTFGFRGEALSSIAAVSKMILITKESESPTGVRLSIEEGQIIEEKIAACNTGTDITILDLFYTVPARKKFLRSKETEWRTISHLFFAFAIAYPQVSFKLFHEGKQIYHCPRALTVTQRMGQLYDMHYTKQLLEIETTLERLSLKLTGVVGDSSLTRFDRSGIFLFVNNRWVKNTKLLQAFIKGYRGMLATDKLPVGALFITVDPAVVDINIHPRKEEVQFLHPKMIENCIQETIQKRLENNLQLKLGDKRFKFLNPELSGLRKQKFDQAFTYSQNAHPHTQISSPLVLSDLTSLDASQIVAKGEASTAKNASFAAALESAFDSPTPASFAFVADTPALVQQSNQPLELSQQEPVDQQPLASNLEHLDYKLVGQFQKTYILLETAEGLTFIDQHAAHERVIYEQLKKNFETITKIQLLFPHVMHIAHHDLYALEPLFDLFAKFGMSLERIGEQELMIRETPVYLKNQSLNDIVYAMISEIYEHKTLSPTQLHEMIHEKLHAKLSCTAAVKAGDTLTHESMHEIIKNLYTTENKLTCPHGRPTLWALSLHDIKKKFKRDYQ